MLNYSPCKITDRKNAIALSKAIFKENMEEQFLCLFGEKNISHMFLAKDIEKIVSMVNYYPATVKIKQIQTKVASIGSVCTLEEYRGKGIAYKLLLMAEEQMLKEHIRIAIISGDGGVYSKFGSTIAGNIVAYTVTRNVSLCENQVDIRPFEEKDIASMYQIYRMEEMAFERSFEEFKLLLKGQTYPDTFADYPIYIISENKKITAYIIFNRQFGKRKLIVKEFAGNRKNIVSSLVPLLIQLKKTSVTLLADPIDPIAAYLLPVKKQKTSLHASLKIVNFEGLMDDLQPYFAQWISEEELHSLKFIQKDDAFTIAYGEKETLELSQRDLNLLVFGSENDIITPIQYPNIKRLLEIVFPIPFVWVNNLNYQ